VVDEIKSNDIEKQTSVGAYLVKQLYQQAVVFGSIIGGAYLGLMASKPFFKAAETGERAAQLWQRVPAFIRKMPGLAKPMSANHVMWGGGIGMLLGSLTGGITLGYEHWKKIKQSQLQVDEITRDISDIEVFKKTDPELKAENERLWAELKKHDGGSMVEKIGGHKKESWKEAADAAQAITEASR
jgi:hypothetical protein